MKVENKAYQEGQDAFHEGEAINDNPYEVDDEQYFSWDEGFTGQWLKSNPTCGDYIEDEE